MSTWFERCPPLTPLEKEIMFLLGQGMSDKELVDRIQVPGADGQPKNINYHSLRYRFRKLFRLFDVNSRGNLQAIAESILPKLVNLHDLKEARESSSE